MITAHKRKLLLSRINKIGAFISTTQADEMITRYQHQHPGGVGSFLYDSKLFKQLLSVPGCEGIRIINAIHEDVHTLVFVAVDSLNRNITKVMDASAPIIGKGTALAYYSLQEMQEQSLTAVGATHGALITKAAGTEMIEAYQALIPGTIKSNLYGREVFEALLSIEGCSALRICNGINDEGDHKAVLIPLDARFSAMRNCQVVTSAGVSFMENPIVNLGMLCPPWCPGTDFIVL